ncbi:ATP-dependent helicase HrpB [Aneurinibacillus soli]|uniref:ATP-dependent RNA helicase HrpB n=1 Tax=Aneurinibacillus soli TaxID=1500254 RepID=A0A0U5B832_9BACL|nr:ATP-dependent helicase HrpB [Aneurinibacillus soli]PYE61222.1 ATP-dependent helicase HrpB [Aneurinibacillus soli]BAU26343.1 ATP-dependent RNA helicase HrpB [Aneurinibacillus soli]
MTKLPIKAVISDLREALRTRQNAVLIAAPGAGKTTHVPLALLDEPWLTGQRILMLEPRRLAARTAARYMAASLGEKAGETIGYRVKMDTKVGPTTRVEVITEGVLTRLLQNDPALEGVGLVIFDEFHERNLHADLGLALCLQSQSLLRDDLRILVMSATLETEPVAALLNGAPVIESAGQAFPVETYYAKQLIKGTVEAAVVQTIQKALQQHNGDVLVFLPGAGEIRRVERMLVEIEWTEQVRVAPLYGNLSRDEQDQAIAPGKPGERKIVLATSIAETSLTVEGVRIVIDSGLMRVARFSPRTGMTRLETIRVSRASADQRRGRAGRLSSGICFRLWTEEEDRQLAARLTPEILETDLAPLTLALAEWGAEPRELLWLDAPPIAALAQARELLMQLGALGEDGTITSHGRQIAELGVHPRLAHMMLRAKELALGGLACELAAVLSERDFVRGERRNADTRLRIDLLHVRNNQSTPYQIDEGLRRRIWTEAEEWKRQLAVKDETGKKGDWCGLLLSFAYPDRIAQRRENGRFLLSNGRGAMFAEAQAMSMSVYLVAAELGDDVPESRIFLAAPVDIQDIIEHAGEQVKEEQWIVWDHSAQAVRARNRMRLGALILSETPLVSPNPDDCLAALLAGIREEGMRIFSWNKASKQLRERLAFLYQAGAETLEMSDEALLASLEEWAAPHVYGLKSRAELERLNMKDVLEGMLSWEDRQKLDAEAPTHIIVPSGSRIPIDYSDPQQPVLAVRLQEVFGLMETPCIARGRIPLLIHLLSPANRPVQVTRDLASFWCTTYFEIKKDLKGRYPKHYWPDDPLNALPTNRVRPRQ